MRRVAWAVFLMRVEHLGTRDPSSIDVYHVRTGGVRGKQSINRGETYAFKEFLEALRLGDAAKGVFVTDSGYVLKGFRHVRAGLLPKSHVDLWRKITELAQGKDIETWKIDSHQSEFDFLRGGQPLAMFVGSTVAGDVASCTAARIQVPRSEVATREWRFAIAGQVRARCAETLIEAKKEDPKPPPAQPALDDAERVKNSRIKKLLQTSEHKVAWGSHRVTCKRCQPSASVIGITKWLPSPCRVTRKRLQAEPEFTRLEGLVRIGRKDIHESHIVVHDPITDRLVCTSCAHTGRVKLHELGAPCTRHRSEYGERALGFIERGLRPGNPKGSVEFTIAVGASGGELAETQAAGPQGRLRRLA